MSDAQLFETAVRDAVVVLKLMQDDVFTGPAYTTADLSTEKAQAAGWTFKQIEAEAERRVAK
ncbi:hypothetical protein [Streptomyces sp. NBC_01716]|uniref:hypothetical protein n=1 Tax=Streptomyces sp. NBC_01716 TaxID=2975917 RepID=UPI002E2EEFFD|nr:hypothetical protein [Streptomyces sp. NBC_01716]